MKEYWKSTGPAGFGSHTEIQPTLLLLVKNDGGQAITFGCSKVIIDGNITTEIYYPPHKVKLLLDTRKVFKQLEGETKWKLVI